MAKHNISDFTFNTIFEFLDDFTPPSSSELYDHENERAAVINKYNFTQEIIHSKDKQKQELITKFENKIPQLSEDLQFCNQSMFKVKDQIKDLNAINIVNEQNERIKKLHDAHNKFINSVKSSPIEPLLIPSLDEKSRNYINNKLGIETINSIPEVELNKLKEDFSKGIVTKQEYEKKYNSLALQHSSIKIKNDFYINVFNYLKDEMLYVVRNFDKEDSTKVLDPKDKNFVLPTYKVNNSNRHLLRRLAIMKVADRDPDELIGSNQYATLWDHDRFNEEIKDKNAIMIRIIHMMFAADFKGEPLDENQTREYKAKYGNDGNDRFYFKRFNGKRYFSSSDLDKLEKYDFINSKNPEDVLFLIDLMEKAFESISSLNIVNNFKDAKYYMESAKWRTFSFYKSPGVQSFKDGLDYKNQPERYQIRKNLEIVQREAFAYALGIPTPSKEDSQYFNKNGTNYQSTFEEFAKRAREYMKKVGREIYNKFPSHISEYISISEIEEWADILIDVEMENIYFSGRNFLLRQYNGTFEFPTIDETSLRVYNRGLLSVETEDLYSTTGSKIIKKEERFYKAANDSAYFPLEKFDLNWFQNDCLHIINSCHQSYIKGEFLAKLEKNGRHPNWAKPDHPQFKGNEHRSRILKAMLDFYENNLNFNKRPISPKTLTLSRLQDYFDYYKNRYGIDLQKVKKPDRANYRMTPIDEVKEDFNTIKRLFVGVDIKSKASSPYLSDIIDLEKKRGIIINTHNAHLNHLRELGKIKDDGMNQFQDLVKKLKDLKMENYVVTNNVDKDKFVTTMRTMVDMIKVGGNEDKIIDLTDIDNFDSAIEGFEKLLEDLDPITRRALVFEYIGDINHLYQSRGFVDEYEEKRLDNYDYKVLYSSDLLITEYNPKKDIYQLEKVEYNERYGFDKKGIKVYEGNHFPLFIDKETLSIYTLEWTAKYPTLTISTVSPEMLEAYKSGSMVKWFEKNSRANTFKKMNDPDYRSVFLNDFTTWYEEQCKKINRKDKMVKVHADTLDRMREIFSLMQSNYFIQLRQPEERSLFIDIDPNYLDKYANNIGAVSFMNSKDEALIMGFSNYENYGRLYENNYAFIDPLNYKEKASSSMIEANFRKIYGLNKEEASKVEMKTILTRVKQLAKEEVFENTELLMKNSLKYIYGDKSISTNELPENIRKLLDEEIKNLRLFTNMEDLEKYREEFEKIMSRKMEIKEVS